MKICLTSGVFPPRSGGPSRQTYDLAVALARRGLQVVVITLGDTNTVVVEDGFKKYSINGFYGPKAAGVLSRLKRLANVFWQIGSILRRERPQVVQHQTSVDYLSVVVALWARVLRIPSVAKYCIDLLWAKTVAGGEEEEVGHEEMFTRGIAARWLTAIERSVLKGFSVVWATAPAQVRVLTGIHGMPERQVRLFPNYVHLAPFYCDRWLTAASQDVEVLTVARFHRGKRLDVALRVFAAAGCMDARMTIVGGEDAQVELELKRLADDLGLAERVAFAGSVSPLEMPRYFQQADVFFLPTAYETFGIVFLEAMAAGIPIVSTRAGSIPEVVPDGWAGFLVEPWDLSSMAAKLARLLRDPELRLAMGRYGQEWSRRYELAENVDRFMHLYEDLGRRRAEKRSAAARELSSGAQ